jgi:hypothetical protein
VENVLRTFAGPVGCIRKPDISKIEHPVRILAVEDWDELTILLAIVGSYTNVTPSLSRRGTIQSIEDVIQLMQINFLEPDE